MNPLPLSAANKPGLYLWGAALFSLMLILLVAAPTLAPCWGPPTQACANLRST